MPSKILSKIELINRKLSAVEKVEEHLEKLANREDQEIKKIEEEEKKIEASLLKLGNFTIKKSHVMELFRGVAGAFLGVGLGQALGGSVNMAKVLPWSNVLGILIFILVFVGILIYKNDKDQISEAKQSVFKYISRKLLLLYFISLIVQLLGLILFNNFPGWNEVLLKALIVGSYSAMSSAVAFTLI